MNDKGKEEKESVIGFYILDDCGDKLWDAIFHW